MKIVPRSRIVAMENTSPNQRVRVYSMQGREAYEALEHNGYLTGSAPYIEGPDHDWSTPYRWMREQMAAQIPDFSGDYPVWAWMKRPSTKNKPQRYRGTGERYRITALVPRSRILMSDYDRWHTVLNNNPMSHTEAEWDEFHTVFPHHESYGNAEYRRSYQQAVEATWPRVFDFSQTGEAYWSWNGKPFRIQLCIDRIYRDEIVSVREFPYAAI